jgi:hypothetical protein
MLSAVMFAAADRGTALHPEMDVSATVEERRFSAA